MLSRLASRTLLNSFRNYSFPSRIQSENVFKQNGQLQSSSRYYGFYSEIRAYLGKRYTSNLGKEPPKRKVVGYWVAACGGMVFAAVALGSYFSVYQSICTVVEKAIENTKGK